MQERVFLSESMPSYRVLETTRELSGKIWLYLIMADIKTFCTFTVLISKLCSKTYFEKCVKKECKHSKVRMEQGSGALRATGSRCLVHRENWKEKIAQGTGIVQRRVWMEVGIKSLARDAIQKSDEKKAKLRFCKWRNKFWIAYKN